MLKRHASPLIALFLFCCSAPSSYGMIASVKRLVEKPASIADSKEVAIIQLYVRFSWPSARSSR